MNPQEISKIIHEMVSKIDSGHLTKDDALRNRDYFSIYENYPSLFDILFDPSRFQLDDLNQFLDVINGQSSEQQYEKFFYDKYQNKISNDNNKSFDDNTLHDHNNNKSLFNSLPYDKTLFDFFISNCCINDSTKFYNELQQSYEITNNYNNSLNTIKDILLKYNNFFQIFLKFGPFHQNKKFILKSSYSLIECIQNMSKEQYENSLQHFPKMKDLHFAYHYNYETSYNNKKILVDLQLYIYNENPNYTSLYNKYYNKENEFIFLSHFLKIILFECLYNATII